MNGSHRLSGSHRPDGRRDAHVHPSAQVLPEAHPPEGSVRISHQRCGAGADGNDDRNPVP